MKLLSLALVAMLFSCREEPVDEPEFVPNPVCALPESGIWYAVFLLTEDRTPSEACPFSEDFEIVLDRDHHQGILCPQDCICDSDFATSTSCSRHLIWTCGSIREDVDNGRLVGAVLQIACEFEDAEATLAQAMCRISKTHTDEPALDCSYFMDMTHVY